VTDPEGRTPGADVPRHDPATDLPPVEATQPSAAVPAAVPAAAPPAAALPVPATAAAPVPATATNGPLADVIAKPKPSSSRGTSLLLVLAAAIAVGGIAFAAGRLTAPAATATAGRQGFGQFPVASGDPGNGQGFPGNGQLPGNGQGFPGRDGLGGISVKGTVSAVSADSLTIKLASGSEVTVPLSSSTTYHSATTSSAAAVTVGSQVSVTPGARTANPAATRDPNASPGPAGGFAFGAASDVTVVEP